jgi:predicted DNA-binding transcriptional regulator AlpA
MKYKFTFTCEIDGDGVANLIKYTKRDGCLDAKEWVETATSQLIERIAKGDAYYSPKEARTYLGLGKRRFETLMKDGQFPNTVQHNVRVLRIPQRDIADYISRRTRSIPESRPSKAENHPFNRHVLIARPVRSRRPE